MCVILKIILGLGKVYKKKNRGNTIFHHVPSVYIISCDKSQQVLLLCPLEKLLGCKSLLWASRLKRAVVVSDCTVPAALLMPRLFFLVFNPWDDTCSLNIPILLMPRWNWIGRPNDVDGVRGGDDRGRRIEELSSLFYHVIKLVHRVVSRLYIHLVLHDLWTDRWVHHRADCRFEPKEGI